MGQVDIWGGEEREESPDFINDVDFADFIAAIRLAKRQLGVMKRTLTDEQKEYANHAVISLWNDSRRFLGV